MKGTLSQRSKGSWSIIVDTGRDPTTGRRRQRWYTVRGTKKQAEAKLVELLHSLETGAYVKPAKLTLGAFLEAWLRDYVAISTRPRTQESYNAIIHRHLIPQLGQIRLTELQPSHLQAYYAHALKGGRLDGKKGGLSARTVHHHHRVVSEALSHALRWGLVIRNVALAVDPPRPERKEMRTLDGDGVHKLLEAAQGTVYYPIVHLAVYTGLRRSELLGLRWKDVDLDFGALSVMQVLHCLRDNRIVFQEPKSAKSKRQVALSPAVVLALKSYREKQEADLDLLGIPWDQNRLLFSQVDGKPMLPATLTHAFIKIVRRVGLDGLRLHDLRHTHASLMLKANVHPKIVSERLGHSSIAITLDTYSHVIPGLQEAAALQFEKGLERTSRQVGSSRM